MKRFAHPQQSGFTLIEVLLVIVLMAVLMGVAVVSLNPSDPARRLQQERERLQAKVGYARLLAETDQLEVGLQLLNEGYRFLRFDKTRQQWFIIDTDPALKPQKTLGIAYLWRDAGVSQSITSTAPLEGAVLPDMLLLSSGEATPGELSISSRDDSRIVPLTLLINDLGDTRFAEDKPAAQGEGRGASANY
jgi:general secretion pathway protein H